jgi:hypothetical protein
LFQIKKLPRSTIHSFHHSKLFCASSFQIAFRACITCFSKVVLMLANVHCLIWSLGNSPKLSGAKSATGGTWSS